MKFTQNGFSNMQIVIGLVDFEHPMSPGAQLKALSGNSMQQYLTSLACQKLEYDATSVFPYGRTSTGSIFKHVTQGLFMQPFQANE